VTVAQTSTAEGAGQARSSIWGHEAQVEQLSQAVATDRVRHAYLLAGPEGIGKTTLARRFAQALNCQTPPAPGVACGECLPCQKIARGIFPDVQTFSLETQELLSERKIGKNTTLTIETVRNLCAATVLRPMEGRWRVILVEDAETLQGVAQEALLKTLEEPPRFMVLILLTNDAEILLPTIRSRCQTIELRPVSHAAITEGLITRGLKAADADRIAALAAGRPGWALRAAKDPKLATAKGDAINRALAWIGHGSYQRLVTAIRIGDSFTKKRAETFTELDTLLGVWRDILLAATSVQKFLKNRGFEEQIRELARSWTLIEIHRALRAVQTCISDLDANVRPRLAMEAMVLQWPKASGP
jgi:DNA polymerase III subunit delta'